jgi:hypothetical protein
LVGGAAIVFMAAFVFPAAADVELTMVEWNTIGSQVQFHLRFHNPDMIPSGPVSGEVQSQPFGAFVQDTGHIANFDVPSLEVDSFFDVFFEVPLSSLPPSADKITPWGGGGGGGGGPQPAPAVPCPPDLFWAGNVDVFWNGPGGAGQANAHYGTLQICPGGAASYIHIFGNCPGGASWAFGALCPGWSAALLSSNGMGQPNGPAPNPLPAGFFDGWIRVSADGSVPVGGTCCFVLNMTCGLSTVPINICAQACECPAVPVDPRTWGNIKSLYE